MRTIRLDSTPGTHYTTAIAGNGGTEIESFPGLRFDGFGKIEAIRIKSAENLAWQVEILNDSDEPEYIYRFAATDATQVAPNSWYYSASVSFPIPRSIEEQGTVGIRNLSSTAKTVDTGGALTLTLILVK